jgi:hypothetical protein
MKVSPLPLLVALPLAFARSDPWAEQYGGTPDLSFSGITTFAHLPHERCLDNIEGKVDVAILGVPYDNAVSYRPGESKRRSFKVMKVLNVQGLDSVPMGSEVAQDDKDQKGDIPSS